jgi:serine/threonine-protein kinase
MSLTAGVRIGPYEIAALLGEGGMGQVYRATDTNLGRQVAIKVLPAVFSQDPERLARFDREAKTLATLNHPNIAIIHGLERADGIRALVMELVEGPTLADRIAQGPIPADEALPIARQITEALEAAHEQGIIHRDLKPGNIKLRPDGTVKVLDFGLAKALEPISAVGVNATASPTITSPALMTGVGMLLGTAAYMSPEQARGKAVDKRTDIWAFGCVLYEMVTGRRAFEGEDVSITLAAVMMKEPDWAALSATTPPLLRRLLRSCLEKDSRRRLQAIGDARLEIERFLSGAPEDAATLVIPVARPLWRRVLPWGLTGVLALALLTLFVLRLPVRTAAPAAPVRLEAATGADASIVNFQASLAVSPDGSLLAFAAQNSQGVQELYVRRLTELRATPVTGTEGARDPFFSPDGQSIGFFAGGSLRTIAVTGGLPVTLADAPDDRGGAWAEDGTIIFQPSPTGIGLMRVSSAGGTPAPLTVLGPGEATHRWPQVPVGSAAVIYTVHSSATGFDDATIVARPLPNGEPKVVRRAGYYGRYLPSGHLVYVQQGTLYAAPFNLARLESVGPPVPVAENFAAYPGGSAGGSAGSVQMAWTDSGTAVYLAAQSVATEAPINWMDRTGEVTTLRSARANWTSPRFSPDGRRLAVDIFAGTADLFVYEWARDTLTRVTFDPAADAKPVWTPDGRRIVFRSNRDKSSLNLYWLRADGSGDVQRLSESQNSQTPASWHPSGTILAFYEARPQSGNDLMMLPMEGDEASGWKPGKPTAFLATPFNEQEPMFSPDGRWIAYQAAESGRYEVYVRPFPGPGGRWQISTEGGVFPIWSRTRSELFYSSLNQRLMAASYKVEGDAFAADRPRVWSERRYLLRPGLGSFDLHPDGERFVLAAAPENESPVRQDKLVFIFNFFEELKRLVPN